MKYFNFILFLFFVMNAEKSFAQDTKTDLPSIKVNAPLITSEEFKDKFSNKTFWTVGSPYRLYFSKNSEFILQTLDVYGNIGKGILKGHYTFRNDDRICLNFFSSGASACYLIMKDPRGKKIWGMYDDPYLFIPVNEGKNSKSTSAPQLSFDRWMHGNLIFTPDFHQKLEQALIDMIKMSTKKVAYLSGNFKPKADSSLNSYKEEISNKLMILPFGSIYHDANGKAKTLSMTETNKVAKGEMSIGNKPYDSLWFIDGHKHCWITTANEKSFMNCDYVDPTGATLLDPKKGKTVLHTMMGFSRYVDFTSISTP